MSGFKDGERLVDDLREDADWLNKDHYDYDDLVRLMRFLLGADGCPWDRAQTLDTLRQYMLEEAYEVVEAIENRDLALLTEELGDMQFEIVFQMLVAERDHGLETDQVMTGVVQKMIRRHSHIFEQDEASTADDVNAIWEQNKRLERAGAAAGQEAQPSAMDGVALALPALVRAHKLASRAAGHGFDWPDASACVGKVEEELAELRAAMALEGPGWQEAVTEELGDLLQAAANLGRLLGVNSELALAQSNTKFEQRYRAMEQQIWADGLAVDDLPAAGLDRYWQRVKQIDGE